MHYENIKDRLYLQCYTFEKFSSFENSITHHKKVKKTKKTCILIMFCLDTSVIYKCFFSDPCKIIYFYRSEVFRSDRHRV